ncbi:hypothetical protein J2S89_003559 [Arthrobacter bambusae]|nr:hypothetical protein [Arthrobacter bambusae]MDQ0098756.1 hypothetical protein [Arthrobacter bambusae]
MGPVPFPFPPRHGFVHHGHRTAVLGLSPEPQDRPRGICGKLGYRFRRHGRRRRRHPRCAGFACAASQLKPGLHRSSSNIGKSEPVAFRYSYLEPSRLTQRVPHSNTDAVSEPDRFLGSNYSRSRARGTCGTDRSASAAGSSPSSGSSSGCPGSRSASSRSGSAGSRSGDELGARGDPGCFLPKRRRWNARNFRRRQYLHVRRQRRGQERPLPLELIGTRSDSAGSFP